MMRQIDRLPNGRAILRPTPPMEWNAQTDFALVTVINEDPIMGCDVIMSRDREEAMAVFLDRHPLLSDLSLPFHDAALAHRRASDWKFGCQMLQWLASNHQGLEAWLKGIAAWPELRRVGLRKAMEAFIRVTSPERHDNPRRGGWLWRRIRSKFRSKNGLHIDYRLLCTETVRSL